ncbi:MAG: BamA/TamA family outer membrane protein [Bacteroidetes bacterium]|nr:BamA/TamA family outer membrane protein [Bacteroidota bacterium]
MQYGRQVTASFINTAVALLLAWVLFCVSCTIPKYYEFKKPFVYKTSIHVEGDLKKDEKENLELKLNNQLDDSMRVRTVFTLSRFYKPDNKKKRSFFPVFYRELAPPPAFDTANIGRSKAFMIILLNSLGYYTPVVTDTFRIDSLGKQYRAFVDFYVSLGKNLKLDSVGYSLQTPELQALVMQNIDQSLLKKGKPYSKQIIASELDRIIDLFRNNGYYKFSIKDIYAETDTVAAALIDPALDPFQQAKLLEELKKRRENPTINVIIKQRPVSDSSNITKYYVGKVTVYPDLSLVEDSSVVHKNDTAVQNGITIISRQNKFKPSFLAKNVYLRPGRLFKQDNYYRTLNRFNTQLGAWQNAAIDLDESDTNDTLLNAALRLYPARKQRISYSLEASRNTNDILTTANLFGIGLNVGLRDRNAYKQSVQTTTNVRGGIELGSNFIQTEQASVSHNIYFPQFIIPFVKKTREWRSDNPHTILNLNASYTDRRDFFTLKAVSASWGYQWSKTNKEKTKTQSYLFNPINVEFAGLHKIGDSLQKLIDSIPSLNEAFKTGLIIGNQFVYSVVKQNDNHINFWRMTLEQSGALLGLIKTINMGDLRRFVKADIEYRHHIEYRTTELAMRAFAGGGIAYGHGLGTNQTLPFYKAYWSGGPNSMRGWQVRQLGLGSSPFYNIYDTGRINKIDRFGDVQLEGNIEYRFPLGTVFTVKVKSAIFADFGNIWDRRPIDSTQNAQGSDFNIGRFYKEFAADVGTGLRLDFDYFIIRLDWAYRIRDPQRPDYPNRWFYDMRLADGTFQLGIGYPF